jgi:hypothetical protein
VRLVGLVVYCLFLVEEKEQRKVLTVQEREKVQAAVPSKDGRMWELKSIVSHSQGTYSLETTYQAVRLKEHPVKLQCQPVHPPLTSLVFHPCELHLKALAMQW